MTFDGSHSHDRHGVAGMPAPAGSVKRPDPIHRRTMIRVAFWTPITALGLALNTIFIVTAH